MTWEEEFQQLRTQRNHVRFNEIDLKSEVAELSQRLREKKSMLSKATKQRRALDKQVNTFWKRKKAENWRHRKQVEEKPALGLQAVGLA